ncbi:MAG: VOC family protein [Myxococcales bacterium]|nr:VOC family protein [Myxococcales bacterium]
MKIDFIELAAPDLEAAKKFYGAAFGWTFKDYGGHYADFEGAGISGGFNPQRKPSRDGSLVILYADDLAAAERAVVAAGGEIGAHHEFPGGKRFHFVDPLGNELAVWTKA